MTGKGVERSSDTHDTGLPEGIPEMHGMMDATTWV